MVDPFCFVLHPWLAGIAGRNKLLINTKAHLQRCPFCLPSFGSRFRALVAASPPFLLGDARKWYFSHGLPVITTIRVGPWRRKSRRGTRVWPNPKRRLACPLRCLPVRPNGPRQRRRMDPRSGVKDYVRLSVFLERHPDRSGGILLAER